MAKYNVTTHKIRTTFEKIEADKELLLQKENDLAKFFLSGNYLKNINELYDSGEIVITPENNTFGKHVQRGTILPNAVNYTFTGSIQMPSTMLPFLNFESRFRTTPDRTLTANPLYYTDTWGSNFYTVTGDGDIIWTGHNPPSAQFALVQQWQIDAGYISQSRTKQGWLCDVEWTDFNDGFDYRILSGHIVAWSSKRYDISTGCSGNQNDSLFYGAQYWDSTLQLPRGEIVDISGTVLSLTGQRDVSVWADPGSGCANVITSTPDFSKTLNLLSEMGTLYIYGLRQRWNGVAWENSPGTVQTQILVAESPSVTITSFVATRTEGFYPYYDTGRRFLFYLANFGTPTLMNMPTAGGLNQPGTLPYSTINFKVNPGDYPTKTSEDVLSRDDGSTYLRGETPRVLEDNTYKPVFFRSSKSTDLKETYLVYFYYSGAVLSPANNVSQTFTYDLWNDDYTGVTSYTRTGTDHQNKDRLTYETITSDMWTQVKMTLKNPFYWKETKKVDVVES